MENQPANSILQTSSDSSVEKSPVRAPMIIIAMITLLTGIIIGTFIGFLFPSTKFIGSYPEKNNDEMNAPFTELKLPSDAVLIQKCADRKGAMYVKPTDIPLGPIYMVYNNKVIGIEFMLGQDEILRGKSYMNLDSFNAKVDHMNIGLLSSGHEGYTNPHYHIDMYIVPKEVEESIKCNASASSLDSIATFSARPTVIATASASLVPVSTHSATSAAQITH